MTILSSRRPTKFLVAEQTAIAHGWDDDNDFGQIFDDSYRYFCEGGEEPPWVGCVRFAPTEDPFLNH